MTAADLKKYKDNCYSALSRDLTEFEKNFLLISGGILAFSTTFIKDIVKIQDIDYLPILFAAWFLIISSIALMMHAFLKSASASDQLLNAVDNFEHNHKLFKESIELDENQCLEIRTTVSEILRVSKSKLKKLRKCAVILFLLGITMLSVFISINLLIEKQKMNANEKTKLEIPNTNQQIIYH